MTGARENALAKWVEEVITRCAGSADNTLRNERNDPAWDEPLVGFSRGDDPFYSDMKSRIGDFHWTPGEIFAITFKDGESSAEGLTVISWILPQTASTRMENRRESRYPAEGWVRSRNYGEDFNLKLGRHVVETLALQGYRALAPVQSPLWKWQVSVPFGYASNWSERHAAFVSVLGTFGLCDGLITPKGKAMRCGSVIAAIPIPPTPRPYRDHRAYCLFYSKGTCKKCISRCPAGALTERGHDKQKCRDYLFDVLSPRAEQRFGFASYGCGLCQTGVPCESRIPDEP
jgi:epoxyqueuosine reductase QueG